MAEPTQFTAGDTVKFTRSHPDYLPSNGWAMAYTLIGKGGRISDVAGVVAGDGFEFTFSSEQTANLDRGEYRLIGRVSRDPEKFTIYNGELDVHQNLFDAASETDVRHRLKVRLEAIEAVMDRRATTDQQYLAIGGRTLQKMAYSELRELRNETRRELFSLENREGIRNGRANKRKIKVRFR